GRRVLNIVIDRKDRLRRIGNLGRADLFELRNNRAGIVMRHDMARTNGNKISRAHNRPSRESVSMSRGNLFNESQTHVRLSIPVSSPYVRRNSAFFRATSAKVRGSDAFTISLALSNT